MIPLTGDQVEDLAKRLTAALKPLDLQRIVYSATGDQLYDKYVGSNLPLFEQIYQLLIALEKDRTTELVLANVYLDRKFNTPLRNYLLALTPEVANPLKGGGLEIQRVGEIIPDAPKNPFAPGLQTYVRPKTGMVDLGLWLRRILTIERQVCVIEHGGEPRGTGFLVGPQAVLTNWHVVESALQDKSVDRLSCRFDYRMLSDRSVPAGTEVKLSGDAIVAARPYAAAEKTDTPDTPPPTALELDYALLQVPAPQADRGWISLPQAAPQLGDDAPLLIVQHPKGTPMKLAMDLESSMGLDKSGFRLRYRTNTEEGSSGSPCFSMDWDLVALHHFGDIGFRTPYPTYNQGVPAHLIRKDIERVAAAGALLGA